MNLHIKFIPPDECAACGFRPARKNNDNQEVAVEHTWIQMSLPGSVVWFYICPSCGHIMPNKNFLENAKALVEMKKSMIVAPPAGGNVLSLSGRN